MHLMHCARDGRWLRAACGASRCGTRARSRHPCRCLRARRWLAAVPSWAGCDAPRQASDARDSWVAQHWAEVGIVEQQLESALPGSAAAIEELRRALREQREEVLRSREGAPGGPAGAEAAANAVGEGAGGGSPRSKLETVAVL